MKLKKEKMALTKGVWSPEEDRKLTAYINRYRIWNWDKMAEAAGLLRSGKSCRLRWVNYLKPGIKHGRYTREEDETINRMHKVLGNKWSKIAAALPGRTDNGIKNRWHTHLRKLTEILLVKQTQIYGTAIGGDGTKMYSSQQDDLHPMCNFPEVSNSSDDTKSPASVITSETDEQNKETVTGLPNIWETLDLESLTMGFHDPGTVNYYSDQWEPEIKSPFGSYDDGTDDLWSIFSVPADIDAVLEPIVHF